MAHFAVVRNALVGMAFFALDHLHGGYAVSGNDVFTELGGLLFLGHIPVASGAFKTLSLVRRVREENVVGLPCIDFPGDFTIFCDVVIHQYTLVFRTPLGGFMAFLALVDPGYAGISAVGAESMAGVAVIVRMRGVTEVDRLGLLGVKQVRKDDPPESQRDREAEQEEYNPEYFA